MKKNWGEGELEREMLKELKERRGGEVFRKRKIR